MLRHHRRTDALRAVSSERCRQARDGHHAMRSYLSPVLRQLHWLPVRQRVVFKIATLVYRSLAGNAPVYLAGHCPLVADARVRQLRSSDTQTLIISRTCSSFGDRTFAAAGPLVLTVCRPISDYVGCHTASSGSYCRHFYLDSDATAQCELFLTAPNRNTVTY